MKNQNRLQAVAGYLRKFAGKEVSPSAVLMNWKMANNFGWGILALNVFSHWANDPSIRPVMGGAINPADLAMTDPLRMYSLQDAIRSSNDFLGSISADNTGRGSANAVVIDPVGNDFAVSNLHGRRNIGRCIFENTDVAGKAASLSKYDSLLTASRWNAEILRHATGREPKLILEGIDESLFCPGPKSGLLPPDRFYVFSGGKIEFRKGQDLVLEAFRKFASRRRDAVLVTAWHSPWPGKAAGFQGRLDRPLALNREGSLDVAGWARANGVAATQILDLGPMRSPQIPAVLREMDVALQPSRAEACTNLCVKEAMACGLPVIAGLNTGMLDILTSDNSIPLRHQTKVAGARDPGGMDGWGESDIDEIVASLDFCYQNRTEARKIGNNGRAWLIDNNRTWRQHALELKEWILSTD